MTDYETAHAAAMTRYEALRKELKVLTLSTASSPYDCWVLSLRMEMEIAFIGKLDSRFAVNSCF